MPVTIGGYGQFYGNAGGGEVGAMMLRAQQNQVNFARMVEIEKLNMQKRALREQEAAAAAKRADSDRNYELAQSRLAMEQQRLDFNDALRQDQKAEAEEKYRQALLMKEQARQDALRKQAEDQAIKQQQLELQQRRQDSRDAYMRDRLDIMRQKQDAATAAKSASASGKGPSVSVPNYNAVLDDWLKGLEDTKKAKIGWMESQAKAERKLADEGGDGAEAAAVRANILENWDNMDENHRYGDAGEAFYQKVKANKWSDKEEKILTFGKTFKQFARIHPEIYTKYGLQPMFDSIEWDAIEPETLDLLVDLMKRPYATDDDLQLIVSLIGGPTK